jgi:hypothetical protein
LSPAARLRRRGGVYVAVLAISTVVAILGVAAAVAVRADNRAARRLADADEAIVCARSAIEMGRACIAADANWRTTLGNGVWFSGQKLGAATFTLEARDPSDGDVTNAPNDPLVLRATAVCGGAKQVVEAALTADPIPLPLLRCAVHTGGQFHLRSNKTFLATGSTVSTNGAVRNDGTIQANVECNTMGGNNLTVPAPYLVYTKAAPKTFPNRAATIDYYAALGKAIAPGTTIDKKLLAPGVNPWGSANPGGVYVIRTTSDLTIKDSRIYGTLVVLCPGRKVTVDNSVVIHSARADYPTLIVDGDLVLQHDCGSGIVLSEAAVGMNFNPAGAPYDGASDSDTADSYTSEVRGLIHVTGTVTFSGTSKVRGVVVCESTATADAVDVGGTDNEIIYDPNLYAHPPQGYAVEVKMRMERGSLRKIVE